MTSPLELVLVIDPTRLVAADQEFGDDMGVPTVVATDSCFLATTPLAMINGRTALWSDVDAWNDSGAGAGARWRIIATPRPPKVTPVLVDVVYDDPDTPTRRQAYFLDRHLALPTPEDEPQGVVPWSRTVDHRESVIDSFPAPRPGCRLTVTFALVSVTADRKAVVEGVFCWNTTLTPG
jgi:hypothetical protein